MKHEAVEKELNANRTRLEKLEATGENLMNRDVRRQETQQLLDAVKRKWADLERQTILNGEKLAASKLKADVTKSLNDVEARMKNLTKEVAQPVQLNDLRSIKDALKKHQDLKNQVAVLSYYRTKIITRICLNLKYIDKKLRVELDLVEEMRQNETNQMNTRPLKSEIGENVAVAIAEYSNKFAALTPLLEKKQKELENALVLKQLLFDLDEQLKWIEQTSRQLEMLTAKTPQTLFDATNVHKKVFELERSLLNNHKPLIDKLLNQSRLQAATCDHDAELEAKAEQLEQEWLRLLKEVEFKKLLSARALTEQQCLDELNQIMLSLSEKWLIIDNAIMQSQDETLLNKQLAKLNQLKDDLKGYNVGESIFFIITLYY